MRVFFRIKNNAGITLLELLIVVAILSILVKLSSVQHEMSVRKSRRAEAKIALAAIYNLEKAFYSEYSAYMPSLGAIGYTPEGNKRFYYVEPCYDSIAFPFAGTITGFSGAMGTIAYTTVNMPWPETWNPIPSHACGTFTPVCSAYPNNPQTIKPLASGNLCAACYTDVWTIDQAKTISNCADGLR